MLWRISLDRQWWSLLGKPKRGKGSKPGTPAHGGLARRDLTATAPYPLWLTDITEDCTREGRIYHCAIKDLNRFVGSLMKALLVVAAIEMAAARRDGLRLAIAT